MLLVASCRRLSHAIAAATALLGCGNHPEPATAPATSASAPSAIVEPAPSAVVEPAPSAVASAPSAAPSVTPAPPASASVVATGDADPPPVLFPQGPLVKGSKSVTYLASVTGGGEDAQTVVKKNRWRFKACHSKALTQDPESEGKVTLVVKVDAAGAVTAATVSQSSASADLTSCVLTSAKSMKFAASAKPEPISFVLMFKPTNSGEGIGLHTGVAADGGPPPPLSPTGPIVKGPKSFTNIVSVTGGGADAKSVVNKNLWRFKSCHDKSLAQDPSSEGKVTVAAKVDAEGAVTDATANGTGVPSHLATCVRTAAQQLKFAPGPPTTLTFILGFKPI